MCVYIAFDNVNYQGVCVYIAFDNVNYQGVCVYIVKGNVNTHIWLFTLPAAM